ncbi:MAG: Spy/CpxP family protein refolding chaperone [Rhodoferax sp.]|nr:Spy/CpxP family protein refolding chaperone [Rhodoferax sp.]
MATLLKPLLIAVAIAGAGLTAQAQPAAGGHGGPMGHHQRMDTAKMQEMVAKRQSALKAQLKLSAAQEPAWNAYVASMQPPADMAQRMDPQARRKMHEEMMALSTPQRIDRMNAMKAERDAAMAKRHEATKTFYAALTPEQQKVFDAQAMGRGGHDGPRGKHGAHQG